MRRKRVAFFFGGRSVEHEISVLTALQMMSAVDTQRYEIVPVYVAFSGRWYTGKELMQRAFYQRLPGALKRVNEVYLMPYPGGGLRHAEGTPCRPIDVAFPCFHGELGEDGSVQGLFELADLPYTGCNVLSAALTMDKPRCKALVAEAGIPVLPTVRVHRSEARANIQAVKQRVLATLDLPLFVKPAHLGSSVGIGRVDSAEQLLEKLANGLRYDQELLLEPCVENLLEINVAVLEGEPPIASVVEVPVASDKALTYEDKYMRGAKGKLSQSAGMAALTRVIDPVDLAQEHKDAVTAYALRAFELLGCQGSVRFDFMLDTQKGALYFNEPNSLPGSLAFYLWEKSNPPLLLTDVLTRMIEGALRRKADQSSVHRDFGLHVLKAN